MQNQTFPLMVNQNTTVEEVKMKITEQSNFESNKMVLMING